MRLLMANRQLLAAEQLDEGRLKYTFVKGHPMKKQERLSDMKVSGRYWYDPLVTFISFQDEAYTKLDKRRRYRNRLQATSRNHDSSTSDSSDDSSSSSSSSSSDDDKKKKRKKKREKKRASDALALLALSSATAAPPLVNPLTAPPPAPVPAVSNNRQKDEELLRKMAELKDDMVKVKEELHATGLRRGSRGRGNNINLTEVHNDDLEEELDRREYYYGERERFPRREGDRYPPRRDWRQDNSSKTEPLAKAVEAILDLSKNLALVVTQNQQRPPAEKQKEADCWDCGLPGHFRGDAICTGPRNKPNFPKQEYGLRAPYSCSTKLLSIRQLGSRPLKTPQMTMRYTSPATPKTRPPSYQQRRRPESLPTKRKQSNHFDNTGRTLTAKTVATPFTTFATESARSSTTIHGAWKTLSSRGQSTWPPLPVQEHKDGLRLATMGL